MAWIAPTTRTTGELITAAIWNVDVVDNLLALKSPPTDTYTLNEGANYTTTSVTFVDVDAVNLALTITTTGGAVLVHFDAYMFGSGGRAYLDFVVDGVRHAGDDGLAQVSSSSEMVSFTRLVIVTGKQIGRAHV